MNTHDISITRLFRRATVGGLVSAAGLLMAQRPLSTADALLNYSFNDGRGMTVFDSGPMTLNLSAGSAFGWGVPGSGVAGGEAMGRLGDRDVFLENTRAAGAGLDGLRSFTLCGWYKSQFVERTQAALFELSPAEGLGYQLHLAARPGPDGKLQYSLVSAVIPAGGNPHRGTGVLYSPWENPCATEGQWIFFAVVVDLQENARMLTFYVGSETDEPRVLLGSLRKPSSWTGITQLGRIEAVRMANSMDMKQPVPVGFYFDDISFYGSSKDSHGALTRSEIQAVWQRSVEPKGAVK
ncbi:MAG: hypothetical protein WC205_03725 [Opitutaceae bacterium]|jgi:hypothetical protein